MDGKRLVTLDTFDGFRCDINKQVSPYMAVVHSFMLGTSGLPDGRRSSYTFLTQVADEQGLLMARVDPARGSIDGRIHRAVLGGLAMCKVQLGLSPDGQGDQVLGELDFGGLTWTGNLKYGSMGGGIVYGCNYLQAITPKLVMGGEGMYISANQSMLSNYTLKYSIPAKTGEEDTTLAAVAPTRQPGAPPGDTAGSSTMCINYNASQAALSCNYKRVVTPNRVTLGAELQCNPFTFESQVLVGAEFKLQRSRIAFGIDGGGRMQTLVEAKLGMAPGSPTLNFSADVDHLKDEMKFGYGINIDG
jgi:mitochondrial import receptor subunit TOM40